MARLLGLDIGDQRVGVAMTDEGGVLASPYKTYRRMSREAEEQILCLIRDHEVQKIVVGLPLDESGERTVQCESVEKFVKRLQRRCTGQFIYHDEYGSTKDAEEILSANRPKGREKGMVDAASAAIILQAFIDRGRLLIGSEPKGKVTCDYAVSNYL